MEPCTNCDLLDERKHLYNSSSGPESTPPQAKDDGSTFLNIVLPVILVVGVFVVVGLGLVVHRLILRQIRKLWDHGGAGNNSSSSAEGRTYTRRGGVNTVSGNFADLPTYRQVLQTIQKEEMPPSYYDISGITNVAFTTDTDIQVVDETTMPAGGEKHHGNALHAKNNSEQSTSSNIYPKLVPSRDSSEMASYCYKHRLPPAEEISEFEKQDIDDVINSISVPSILSEIEIENYNQLPKNKRKSFKLKRPKQQLTNKSPPNMPPVRNVSVIVRSTRL